VRREGSVARNTARTLDAGTITVTQCPQVITATYDTAMMAYSDDDSMAQMFQFNMPVTFTLMGGPDIAAQSAMITMPPAVDGTTFTGPVNISRSMPNVFTWTPPADTSGNLTVSTFFLDTNNARVVICSAPACGGMMTVSPLLFNRHYADGESLFQGIGFHRRTVVTSGAHSIDLRLEAMTFAMPNTVM
jgi:hypothetical protein